MKWFVEVGQRVEEFDTLCEVQSDKSTYVSQSLYDSSSICHRSLPSFGLMQCHCGQLSYLMMKADDQG